MSESEQRLGALPDASGSVWKSAAQNLQSKGPGLSFCLNRKMAVQAGDTEPKTLKVIVGCFSSERKSEHNYRGQPCSLKNEGIEFAVEAYDYRNIEHQDRSRQLLCLQLSAVLAVETGIHSRCDQFAEPVPARRAAARPLHSHPVLSQAVQILLLQSLHGQERVGDRGLSQRADQRERNLQPHACSAGA